MLTKARFILSKTKALEQYKILKELSDIVSYSLKTNFEVGKVLEENTDCMFTLHFIRSLDEIKDKKRVWFAAQAWDSDEIEILFSQGISNFIVDNENDLNVLLESLKERKINLLLRMRFKEHHIKTGKHFVYGMYSRQINNLIPELRKNENIEKLGIHFHRITQNISEWMLKYELEHSLSEETFNLIDSVNIGGGIPGKYKNFRAEVLKNIFSEITSLKKWLNEKGIKMIIEPGRFICGESVKLEATIKNVYDNNIVVDCSVYNSDTDAFVSNLRLLVEGELEKGQSYTIKGCVPCAMDIFRYDVKLENPRIGDKIVFLNAGAYNFSTDFCKLDKLDTIIVE